MSFKLYYIGGGINALIKRITKRGLKFKSFKQYFGPQFDLYTSDKGTITFGKKSFFRGRSFIAAEGGTVEFGENNFVNFNCYVVAKESIKIGDNNLFGPNVSIVDHNHIYADREVPIGKQGFESKPIVIGSGNWFCANVVVCAGVTIGDNVVVGANSVVTSDLLESGVYAGCPAKLIKRN